MADIAGTSPVDTTIFGRKPGTFLQRVSPSFFVLLFTFTYLLVTLAIHQWNPMAFVAIGERYNSSVGHQNLGYDGQFYYAIANDPLDASSSLDNPSFRYQRILYPLLARLLSLGQPMLLPWVLIFINWISASLGTWVLSEILARNGVSRWYSLSYGLFVGLLMSIRLDLTEPLAYLLVNAGVLTYLQKRYRWSAAYFALAALTRETTLLFSLAYGFTFFRERKNVSAFFWGLSTIIPFILWQVTLKVWLGNWGVGSGGALATPFEWIPLHGWWGMASNNLPMFLIMSLVVVPLAILPAIISILLACVRLLRHQIMPTTWALLLNGLVFTILPMSNLMDPLGLSRITIGLVAAILHEGSAQKSKRMLNYSLLWIITAIFIFKDSLLPFGS